WFCGYRLWAIDYRLVRVEQAVGCFYNEVLAVLIDRADEAHGDKDDAVFDFDLQQVVGAGGFDVVDGAAVLAPFVGDGHADESGHVHGGPKPLLPAASSPS